MSNVVVIADDVTASFYASAGIQFLSADLFNGSKLEAELVLNFLNDIGCELLLVTDEYWSILKDLGIFDKLPPVVLIPSFKTGSTKSLPVLKSLSERALGFSFLAFEDEDDEDE